MKPYYRDDLVTIYHADCKELPAAAARLAAAREALTAKEDDDGED